MPKLVTLYIRQTAIGFVLSGLFVGLLMYFDVANLWHLVTNVSGGWLAGALLFLFNGIVFAGVQFGIAVMAMGRDDDADNGRRGREPVRGLAEVLVPIPVPVKDDRRMRR
ncbi:hypothetical protein BV509_18825 [Rhodovulum sulfidophilum]|uniref:Uncharacterized protein n=1 Tax=Rhodovulum visakhapatnamense TaxID=364297 RepID=A0A4R8FE64_9RHOB|nr:hypothetical protein [Rhodovulum visakhapatnamense]MBL3569072.1 hypothetical protein [Rhodovulum visakhapatnamense]MBL3577034.1 hypothetical protein [Rhodovulum visakhapatnamense]OLS46201.1 hypothetical protein BV509_18825 [Rhodovulum sulfidophilum]TDX24160.1 hypothetical protein EV657_12456 [Rhodovulum visakhapatnamense]